MIWGMLEAMRHGARASAQPLWTVRWVLSYELLQHALSTGVIALLSTLVGMIYVVTLLFCPTGWRVLAFGSVLLPLLLPPVWVLMPFLHLNPGGTYLAHVFVLSPFATWLLFAQVRGLQPTLEAVTLHGVSAWRWIRWLIWELRYSIKFVFLLLFGLAWMTYAVSALVGFEWRPLEDVILERLRSGHGVLAVCIFSLSQMWLWGLVLSSGEWGREITAKKSQDWSAQPSWLSLLAFIPAVILLTVPIAGLEIRGLEAWLKPVQWTLTLFFLVLFMSFTLYFSVAWFYYNSSISTWLRFYWIPSLPYFIFVMWPLQSWSFALQLLGLSFLISCFSFPFLYHFVLQPLLERFRDQVEVARVLGANHARIFQMVLYPQIRRGLWASAVLTALWSTGEFVLSAHLTMRPGTLAVEIYDRLSSYQMVEAQQGVFLLGVFAALVFFAWVRNQYVEG